MHKKYSCLAGETVYDLPVYDYMWLARLCVQHEPNITGDDELHPHVEKKKGQII